MGNNNNYNENENDNDSNMNNENENKIQQTNNNNNSDNSDMDIDRSQQDPSIPENCEEQNYNEEEEEVYDEFNPYLFMKQLPPYEEVAIDGKICLPVRKYTRSQSQLTLVLDLDETLVH